MLLASQHDNKIPFNKRWIAQVIHSESRINWDAIFESGIIECYQDASAVLAIVHPRDRDRDREEAEKTPIVPKGDLCEIGKNCNGKFEKCNECFDRFWTVYPRHDPPRKETRKKWCTQFHKGLDINAMLRWIESAAGRWTEKKYIPQPTTWLNQRRWEGDLPPGIQDQVELPLAEPDEFEDPDEPMKGMPDLIAQERERRRAKYNHDPELIARARAKWRESHGE